MTVDDRTLEEAYREGPFSKDKTRSIMVRFHHPADRRQAWKLRDKLVKPIHFRQVFSDTIQGQRKALHPIFQYAKTHDEFKDNTFIRHDRLIVKGKSYNMNDLNKLPSALKVAVGCTHEKEIVYFYHYPTKFTIDDIEFNSVEQAFFYGKAIHYNRPLKAAEILATVNPVRQKNIGDSFGEKTWDTRVEIMKAVVREKFKQSSYLKAVLLSTGIKTLIEANPHDSHWGAGISATAAKANSNQFPGDNVMGCILMEIRDELKPVTEIAPAAGHE